MKTNSGFFGGLMDNIDKTWQCVFLLTADIILLWLMTK